MNCQEIRELLPALAYGDVPAEIRAKVDEHLAICQPCRAEQAALAEVGRLLDLSPVPKIQVNVPRIYAEARRRQERQTRRWRRVAFAALGMAAALLVVLCLKLDVRWQDHQLVLRFGPPDVADKTAEPKPLVVAERLTPQALPPQVTATDLQLVRDLVHALAATVEERDSKFDESLARLELQLTQAQNQARTRWAATERYVSALYTSQMASNAKGER
jgi:predicted anti-sigma-YlaC factor YlaD